MRISNLMMTIALGLGTAAVGAPLAAADAPDPEDQPDGSWISMSGTVTAPTASAFTLDYGEGMVLVEVDDWDHYGEAAGLLDGDEVTVTGRVDDDLYESTSIEASSVYVEDLNTYFYASAADEEGAPGVVLTTRGDPFQKKTPEGDPCGNSRTETPGYPGVSRARAETPGHPDASRTREAPHWRRPMGTLAPPRRGFSGPCDRIPRPHVFER